MLHAGRLFQEQQLQGAQAPDKETETLLVKRVEREDGRVVEVVVGQSTLPQTVFNSVNVLIGVGLLSLPLGLKYSGWLIGMAFLCSCAIVTKYTASILAKCLTTNDSLVTFTDLAYVAFGTKGRLITSVLFCLELVGACVALVTLFADSLDAIIPGWGIVAWKILCGLIIIPLSFVPLRLLSFTSVLGIMSCFGSEHAPGGPGGSFSRPY
jgi:vesicular inhibitory amino acid transporter